jgi:hypothetical protein
MILACKNQPNNFYSFQAPSNNLFVFSLPSIFLQKKQLFTKVSKKYEKRMYF